MQWLKSLGILDAGPLGDWFSAHPLPRVCWYPSAGEDFRDLLYLSKAYAGHNPAEGMPEPGVPDLFLHTDYFPWSESSFLDSRTIHADPHTHIEVKQIALLPPLQLPVAERLVVFPHGSHATNRVVALQANVESDVLGRFEALVLYAFAENAAFCAKVLLSQGASISHVIRVRHGGGCGGGGHLSGAWLTPLLPALHTEVLVSDCDPREEGMGRDALAFEVFPELETARRDAALPSFEPFRSIPGANWSAHGRVTWYACGRTT